MWSGFTSKPSRQLETTFAHFEYFSSLSFFKERDTNDRIGPESSQSPEKEEVPSCMLNYG